MMNQRVTSRATIAARESDSGMTLIELLVVITIISIVSVIALPQLTGSNRRIGSASIPREIVADLRFARQEALSLRKVVTCRYDNQTKQMTIINHGEAAITYDPSTDSMVKLPSSTAASADVTPDVNVEQNLLSRTGVPASDITFGRPTGVSTAALGDGAQLVSLSASNQINITFQPDGSVVDAQGNPLNRTLFLYNQQIPQQSAFAISVLGTTGRIKLWRYDSNAGKYAE